MSKANALTKPDLHVLPTIKERMTFLYVEHCKITREDGAIAVHDANGVVCVPVASLSVLMLGPGTNVSHRAIELAGDMGLTIVWVGERGVRYYAHGRSLTHSARLVIRQAELVSNTRKRLAVARMMYQMRFPGEDVSALTMQQLRGREGSRIRSTYRKLSRETGVKWTRREYNPDDYSDGTPINQALSAAHACLYGLCHSVIVSIGCSPALGFVHVGHERSFVYDMADLYKAEVTIPIAFGVAEDFERCLEDGGSSTMDVGSETRRRVRDAFAKGKLIERIVKDIYLLLFGSAIESPEVDVVELWDESGNVPSGHLYPEETDGGADIAGKPEGQQWL